MSRNQTGELQQSNSQAGTGYVNDASPGPTSVGRFLEVNPNGRIPALLDNREGKAPICVWESASILVGSQARRTGQREYL
jgi:hypothetical protein